VHGRDQGHVLVPVDEAAQHAQVRLHRGPEALAPVAGENDESRAVVGNQRVDPLRRRARVATGRPECVDDRVARERDAVLRYALGAQRGDIVRRGSEVQGCQLRDEPPVHLLREGAREVAAAQPGFHVTHGYAELVGGQRAGHGGGGVPLDEQQVRCLAPDRGVQRGEYPGGHRGGGLPVFHDLEVAVDAHAKIAREGVEQLLVL
jgi:hypothetical protein